MSFRGRSSGLSLVELLVALAIVALLATVAAGALQPLLASVHTVRCAQQMRQLGVAVLAWSNDHDQRWPRSSHSAFAHGEPGWTRAVLPYLGLEENLSALEFRRAQERFFRCPADSTRRTGTSYGLNVYFELEPDTDDYEGAPAQWRTRPTLLAPSRTILLAEMAGAADHVMAHFWTAGGTGYDAAITRHSGRANYLFADGSLQLLPVEEVFDPVRGINLWHPEKAAALTPP